jgi:hypothetical protein
MRVKVVGLLLCSVLLAEPASAYDPNDQNNCNGVEWSGKGADWGDKRILVVAKVTAPRVNFIKSPMTMTSRPMAAQRPRMPAAGSHIL